MDIVRGKEIIVMSDAEFAALRAPYTSVALDIGTGDGRYPYREARAHPTTLYIGLDATMENLTEYSAKAGKKPNRGGLPNVLYVRAGADALPAAFAGLAGEITVNFPWGSLLTGLVRGEPLLLRSLAGAARPGAAVDVYLNTAVSSEPIPLEVRNLPDVTLEYISHEMETRYAAAGILIRYAELLDGRAMARIPSLWARRLAYGRAPETVHIRAVVQPAPPGRVEGSQPAAGT